jgi:hypothetical protein
MIAIAFALVASVPQTDGAGTAAVMFHLNLRPSNANDSPSLHPLPPPTRGAPYLVSIGDLCHEGLHAVFTGVDSGRYKLNETNLLAAFRVLRKQTCDRSRFQPFALKYATADREKLKLLWRTQAEAIFLLGQIGGVKEIEVLLPLLDDPDWEIRSATLEAITQLGDGRHAYLVYDKLLSPKRFTGQLGQTEEAAIMKAYKALLAKAPPPEKK